MTADCICTILRQAAQTSTVYYDKALAPSGLKVTMFRLLRRIGEAPGISITELSEIVGLDRSTLGRNLRVLERQGLIALATGEDERARKIDLTAHGTAALLAAVPLWQSAQADFAAKIGPDAGLVLDRLAGLSNRTHAALEAKDGQ